MPVTFVGVRHHSPACARLVAATIEELRPAHVLVEGPADMNDRLDELLLDHRLPIAIFTAYRDGERLHASWSPLCDYSPEWVAITAGRSVGAEVRLIDLPAWHPALADRRNRYAVQERFRMAGQMLRSLEWPLPLHLLLPALADQIDSCGSCAGGGLRISPEWNP